MRLETLTAEDIRGYSYNELIGLVQETNRPPGGSPTIAAAARACFLAPGRQLLEIGTATGVTAIELAQLTGCSITAIDINEASLNAARVRARRAGVDSLITFRVDDATALSFDDGTFDVVFCGNVTSLVSDREKALAEYARVLKPGGLLVAVPMYYVVTPSDDLVRDVSQAIQVDIVPHDRGYWLSFFESPSFELLSADRFVFRKLPPSEVAGFCDLILSRPHLRELSLAASSALNEVYPRFMELFRVNLSHMGYSILTLKKTDPDVDRALFVADPE